MTVIFAEKLTVTNLMDQKYFVSKKLKLWRLLKFLRLPALLLFADLNQIRAKLFAAHCSFQLL